LRNRYKTQFPLKKYYTPIFLLKVNEVRFIFENYPKANKYLIKNQALLEKRTYVLKQAENGMNYGFLKTRNHGLSLNLFFGILRKKPTFWMILMVCIVNGDCYWLSCDDENKNDLLWLALAVGNSTFIETFMIIL